MCLLVCMFEIVLHRCCSYVFNCLFVDIEKKKCHLVGFGKAVLGMAVQVERILGDKLVSGMISVPIGTIEKFRTDEDMQFRKNSVVQVFEGAKNNLPDESAEKAARKIFKFVETLTENDVLFVLISGGGSALLSIPATPITLNEKIDVIKMLTRHGADINELNSVRIEISSSKGGKLALAARGAHKVISLLISDICGDPIHLIASGPSVIQENQQGKAKQILEKYGLMNSIPQSVSKRISSQYTTHHLTLPNNSSVHVIGSNSLAIQVGLEEMKKLNFRAIYMSNHIEGDVVLLSSMYCDIAESVYGYASGRLDKTSFQNLMESFGKTLKFEKDFFVQLLDAVMDKTNTNPICLVGGGEPTVNVKGNGIGGRNQELALRVANNIRKNETLRNIVFLSAGTDGIDGPCDGKGMQIGYRLCEGNSFYF